MKKEKCPYYKKCKLYNSKNKICNEEGGFYSGSYPGCHRKMMEKEK